MKPSEITRLDLIQVIRASIMKHFKDVTFSGYIQDLGVFQVKIGESRFDVLIRIVKKGDDE